MKATSFRGHNFLYLEEGLEPYWMFEGWEHERKSREFCLREGDVVIDTGACIGGWTIPAALIGKHVYAFEPNGEYAAVLRNNVNSNFIRNVDVIQKAVWDTDTMVRFNGWTVEEVRPSSEQLIQYINIAAIAGRMYHKPEPIMQGIRIDTFCHDIHPNFIKIDTEGGELHALAGAIETIRRDTPRLMVECHKEYNRGIVEEVRRAVLGINPDYKSQIIYENETQVAHLYFEI